MKVLYLGPERPHLTAFISSCGDTVTRTEEPLQTNDGRLDNTDFIVSYGYRHIIRPPVITRFHPRLINLHISYLPWNRGADPNLWSFLEDTPKGVTIHLIDKGIDSGDILVQSEVMMAPEDTLASSYGKLSKAIEELFIASWREVRQGKIIPRPQPPGGTIHRRRDRAPYDHLLIRGWDTPVAQIQGKALPERCCS